jgi:cobalamin biosynthesis Co2+ chelatase CbiK
MPESKTEQEEKNREVRLRAKAMRLGYALQKSRRALSADNQGGYRIVIAQDRSVVAGGDFDMSLDEVEDYLKKAESE